MALRSEMSETWNEYLQLTLERVNDVHAKNILLHLSKHADRYWTPREIKGALSLPLDINKIQEKLLILSEADMIERGVADIDFRGLQDGTLKYKDLRNKRIKHHGKTDKSTRIYGIKGLNTTTKRTLCRSRFATCSVTFNVYPSKIR
jgi:hypothetical protein